MKIVIVGARADGHGKACLELCRDAGAGEVVGFTDDNPASHGAIISGVPVLGANDVLPELRGQGVDAAFVAIGDNAVRQSLYRRLEEIGFLLPSIVHPTAYVGRGVRIGRGVFLGVNSVLVAGAQVDDFVIVNTAATVDHDCHVKEAAFIGPGAHLAGRVVIGEGAFLGTGAIAITDARIGDWCVIGAGAVVLKETPPHSKCVGVPARPIG